MRVSIQQTIRVSAMDQHHTLIVMAEIERWRELGESSFLSMIGVECDGGGEDEVGGEFGDRDGDGSIP